MSSAAAIPTATGNSMTMRVSVFMIGVWYGFLAVWNLYHKRFIHVSGLLRLATDTWQCSRKNDYKMMVNDHKWMTLLCFLEWFLYFSAFNYNMYIAPIDLTQLGINVHEINSRILQSKFVVVCMYYGFWCILTTAFNNQPVSETEKEHEE